MRGAINTVHILPFFPYSSDRGFSIIDYEEVDPRLGTWDEIEQLCAALPPDVRRRLQPRVGEEPLVPALPERPAGLRGLLRRLQHPRRHRPRPPAPHPAAAHVRSAHPLPDHHGARAGCGRPSAPTRWTSTSSNERVLLRVLDILLDYVRRGADIDPPRRGHLHLARAGHALRAPAADARPGAALPRGARRGRAAGRDRHRDERAARGQRQLLRRRRRTRRRWSTTSRCRRWSCTRSTPATPARAARAGRPRCAGSRAPPPTSTSSTRTTASGCSGAQGILTPAEIDALVERALAHGGLVSLPGERRRHAQPLRAERHLVQRAQPRGRGRAAGPAGRPLPGLAARSRSRSRACPASTCRASSAPGTTRRPCCEGSEARSINRKTIDEAALFEPLRDRHSWVHEVAVRFRRLVRRRIATPAFHPERGAARAGRGPRRVRGAAGRDPRARAGAGPDERDQRAPGGRLRARDARVARRRLAGPHHGRERRTDRSGILLADAHVPTRCSGSPPTTPSRHHERAEDEHQAGHVAPTAPATTANASGP